MALCILHDDAKLCNGGGVGHCLSNVDRPRYNLAYKSRRRREIETPFATDRQADSRQTDNSVITTSVTERTACRCIGTPFNNCRVGGDVVEERQTSANTRIKV